MIDEKILKQMEKRFRKIDELLRILIPFENSEPDEREKQFIKDVTQAIVNEFTNIYSDMYQKMKKKTFHESLYKKVKASLGINPSNQGLAIDNQRNLTQSRLYTDDEIKSFISNVFKMKLKRIRHFLSEYPDENISKICSSIVKVYQIMETNGIMSKAYEELGEICVSINDGELYTIISKKVTIFIRNLNTYKVVNKKEVNALLLGGLMVEDHQVQNQEIQNQPEIVKNYKAILSVVDIK